ncbi:hypothetical protein EYF80_018144 [Liparis tanakae]|uniref:Uncharacterized protein n=1 Tax=Liparis tanakae TaxID=230148 RepID=A0A4Z2I0I0_9TELE|nr:hypothetical protein EYF80_018144 [Liparis tanakae]
MKRVSESARVSARELLLQSSKKCVDFHRTAGTPRREEEKEEGGGGDAGAPQRSRTPTPRRPGTFPRVDASDPPACIAEGDAAELHLKVLRHPENPPCFCRVQHHVAVVTGLVNRSGPRPPAPPPAAVSVR